MAKCEEISSACRFSSNGQLLGLLVLSFVGSSWAQFAVPEGYDGFQYNGVQGNGRGPVVWEVFIDPMCRNCKSGWPALTQVAERYGSSLVIVVHPFPAPFHHNAFFAARALHIAQMLNSSLVYPLLELVFRDQETFSNPSTRDETPAHVISRLISLAGELGVPANLFEAGFNAVATDQATRLSFKYGCSRGVVGTPTYLVNGMTVIGANDGWSVDDWAKILDSMVKEPELNARTDHTTQS
ncbi:hypothetical protein KC19_12G155500 [Ceratodon purpureus]|uniref:Thioredoxin domain-containing protein n=1 Tax=Ceratodon purpureus TaxID=3225 RepID=A0A8T0G903_CERPU|nr:hypothetical protein KC19_12G155500 [Ceratodon purpureus]